MNPLSSAPRDAFRDIRYVMTDMDETLTWHGRLHANTYVSLERLQQADITIIPVTAAPAGWCDQMARMWPVDGVITENGGAFFRRSDDGHGIERTYWHREADLPAIDDKLRALVETVQRAVPQARLADDQRFRTTSVAFARTGDAATETQILHVMRRAGAHATINNLWVLGWIGEYDKLAMARRVLAEVYDVDIDAARDTIAYVGDSVNDAPMFGFFRHTFGVSTVREHLPQIPVPPAWITRGPGGVGFVEVVDAILDDQR